VLVRLQQHELVQALDAPAPHALLRPADAVESLLPHLHALTVIAVEFTGPSEGRGYTQARVLRERYGYRGELRAVGHVKRDQILFLARCGFDSFELAAEESAEGALDSLRNFTVAYTQTQPSSPALELRFRAGKPAARS
jgi:uncharacterized protein (DUF934 family)